jgi:hypothetical protein
MQKSVFPLSAATFTRRASPVPLDGKLQPVKSGSVERDEIPAIAWHPAIAMTNNPPEVISKLERFTATSPLSGQIRAQRKLRRCVRAETWISR